MRFVGGKMPLFDSWYSVIGAVVAYLVVVYSLQQWMKDRKPYSVKAFAFIHNVFLCILSAFMAAGIMFELALIAWKTSVSYLDNVFLCDQHGTLSQGRIVWWFYVFHLSKVYEFLDTVILVLKKKPIIFLHIYHHCITFVLTWVTVNNEVAVQWGSTLANVAVHTLMYYYYAISVLGISVWWKKYITKMQISQFVFDLGLNFTAYGYRFYGETYSNITCSGDWIPWLFGQYVLLSFLVLFAIFYRETYEKKAYKPTDPAREERKKK